MKEQKLKRVLGISGSPRKGGNTDLLLDEALKAARRKGAKTKKIVLDELKFSPCQECKNIRKDGICVIKDDWQNIFSEIENSDGIILASPIFFGSVSAQTKMMIDRFQCQWLAKNKFVPPAKPLATHGKTYKPKKRKATCHEAGRVGAFICVEASRRKDFFENAKSIVRNFFATIDVVYKEELLCSGVDKKGAVRERPECLKRASEIGKKIISFRRNVRM